MPKQHPRMIHESHVWPQLPALLSYPLRGQSAGVIIMFALFLTLLDIRDHPHFIVITGPGLFIMVSWLFKYAFAILENTAYGYADPPAFGQDMLNPLKQKPLKFMAYFLIYGQFAFYLWWLHPALGMVLLAICLLLAPAAAMSIAISNRVMNTLNPLYLVTLAKRLGVGYIQVMLAFTLPVQIIIFLFALVGDLVAWLSLAYVLLLVFHLSGFVMYHHREMLGLEVSFSHEREQQRDDQAHAQRLANLLSQIYAPNQSGHKEHADQAYEAALKALGGDILKVHEELFPRLSLWTHKYIPKRQTQRYISLLIQHQRTHQALEIYLLCADSKRPEGIPNFSTAAPSELLLLAKQAERQQNWRIAQNLAGDFMARYPQHHENNEARAMIARIEAGQGRVT